MIGAYFFVKLKFCEKVYCAAFSDFFHDLLTVSEKLRGLYRGVLSEKWAVFDNLHSSGSPQQR